MNLRSALSGLVTGLVLLVSSAGSLAAASTSVSTPFIDIQGNWARSAITYLWSKGLIEGETPNLFEPSRKVTRGGWAAMLSYALHLPEPTSPVVFQDVPPQFGYYPAIEAVAAAGIMTGHKGLFDPLAPETRADAARSLVLALGLGFEATDTQGTLPYSDASQVPSRYVPYVLAATHLGLIGALPGNRFGPLLAIDRADAAALIYKLVQNLNRPAPPQPTIAHINGNGILLTWPAQKGAFGYYVYREIAQAGFSLLAVVHQPSYLDPQEDGNVPVTYYVQTRTAQGLSLPSAWIVLPGMTGNETAWAEHYGWNGRLQWNLLNAQVGSTFNVGTLVPQNIPLLNYGHLKDSGRRTLVLADSPEEPRRTGILYQGTVSGRVRIYVDVVNEVVPARPVRLWVTLFDGDATGVLVTRGREGHAGPAPMVGLTNWMSAGQSVVRRFLTDKPRRSTGGIYSGGTYVVDPRLTQVNIPHGDLVQAVYDLTLSGPMQVTVSLLPAPTVSDPALPPPPTGAPASDPQVPDFAQLPVLPAAGAHHLRGTFHGIDRTYRFTLPATQVKALMLGDGVADPYLKGVDAVTGKPVTLVGSYGMIYRIDFRPKVNEAVFLIPIGGPYLGEIEDDTSGIFAAPQSDIYDATQGVFIGNFTPGKTHHIVWMAPASSNMPVELIFVPQGM